MDVPKKNSGEGIAGCVWSHGRAPDVPQKIAGRASLVVCGIMDVPQKSSWEGIAGCVEYVPQKNSGESIAGCVWNHGHAPENSWGVDHGYV